MKSWLTFQHQEHGPPDSGGDDSRRGADERAHAAVPPRAVVVRGPRLRGTLAAAGRGAVWRAVVEPDTDDAGFCWIWPPAVTSLAGCSSVIFQM